MGTDINNKRGAFPSDDHNTVGPLDDLEPSDEVNLEQGESEQQGEQIVKQFRRNLANNMRLLRGREDWTQADLGSKVGLSQSQIAFLERERQNISLPHLVRFALLFGLEPMSLLNSTIEIREKPKEEKAPPVVLETAWSGVSLISASSTNSAQDTVLLSPEEAFFGPAPEPSASPTKSDTPLRPIKAVLGSSIGPLNLAVVSRIIGAAHKRIEALRHKHGSVPMTQAMLNGVLIAILNASHDADDDCKSSEPLQP